MAGEARVFGGVFGGGFIAVDWGTSNRRAYRIGTHGGLEADFEDGLGIMSVGKEGPGDGSGGFGPAVAELRARLGDLPLLMAGMIGSNRGWREAGYVACPAGIDDLAEALVWAEDGAGGQRAAIVPGVSYVGADDGPDWREPQPARADVMRGEEVQVLGGVADGTLPRDCLVCHPGTHNKWIEVAGGRITGFRTVMSGEIFGLLKEHSILSDLLSRPVGTGEAFRAGVRHGLTSIDLLAELFQIRARVLLGRAPAADAASYASGLLVGTDTRTGLDGRRPEVAVYVVGRPELTALFAAALRIAGCEPVQVDGEAVFIAGMRRIAELAGG